MTTKNNSKKTKTTAMTTAEKITATRATAKKRTKATATGKAGPLPPSAKGAAEFGMATENKGNGENENGEA
jgi:hypothetical protein